METKIKENIKPRWRSIATYIISAATRAAITVAESAFIHWPSAFIEIRLSVHILLIIAACIILLKSVLVSGVRRLRVWSNVSASVRVCSSLWQWRRVNLFFRFHFENEKSESLSIFLPYLITDTSF